MWNYLELNMQHEEAVGHQKADTLQKIGQNRENHLPEEISFTTWEHYANFKLFVSANMPFVEGILSTLPKT